MTDTAEKTHDYREGYREGAQAVLKAIGDHLPENQIRVLEKWVAGPLEAWRSDDQNAPPPPWPLLDGA